MKNKRLYRSRDNRMIAGIAGGVGEYLGIDPTIVRVIFVISPFMTFGTSVLIYLILMFVIPEAPENHRKKVKNNQSN